MATFLLLTYLLLSGLAVVQAVLVAVQTWEHRRFARSRLSRLDQRRPTGRAVVIAPCRGWDVGLEENLRSLFRQDYDEYELRFVVESTEDPVFAVIRRLIAAHPTVDAQVIVAGPAERSGQKVHNLRVATADLPAEVRYLAFVDSDARLRRQWLRALVDRLDHPEAGAATGYRWFVPGRPSLANHLLSSVNSFVAVLFGSHSPTVVWGGSWAIRREMFEALGLREAWEGTVSDDLVVARLLRRARLRVLFEPACMVVSPLETSLSEMFWFVRRQYLMGRFYLPGWWALALVLTTLAGLPLLGSLGMLGWCLATGSRWAWLPAGVCAALYGLNVVAGWFRQDLVRVYFPHLRGPLRRARRFEVWMGPLVTLVNWIELLGSVFGRQVTWRSIRYRLHRDGQVASIERLDAAPVLHLAESPESHPSGETAEPAVGSLPSDWAKAA